MSANIVIMAKRNDPFARIPHTLLEDERLSWRAKGMLCYLVGKPSGWKVRVTDLRNRAKEGRNAVRTALDELRRLGYAEFVRPRNEKGVFTDGVWKISDAPIFPPFTPRTGKPVVDNPDADFGYHSKRDATKNEFRKNQPEESEQTANQFAEGVSEEEEEIEARWAPDNRTKAQKLKTIRLPSKWPTEKEFGDFIESAELDKLLMSRDTDEVTDGCAFTIGGRT